MKKVPPSMEDPSVGQKAMTKVGNSGEIAQFL